MMFKKMLSKYRNKASKTGFTLIELLVVISIIALLSSIILATVISARSSAGDSRVKEQLADFRTAATIFSNTYGGYQGMCANAVDSVAVGSGVNSSDQTGVYSDITKNTWPTIGGHNFTCFSGAAYYVAISALQTTPGNFWCVDSTGASMVTTSVPSGSPTSCSYSSASYLLSVTITISSGGGTITGVSTPTQININCSTGTCSNSYTSGTSVTLTATPNGSSSFNGWGGACATYGMSPTCTVNISNAAQTATASFASAS